MIRMMTSINPSDMALSPKGGGRAEIAPRPGSNHNPGRSSWSIRRIQPSWEPTGKRFPFIAGSDGEDHFFVRSVSKLFRLQLQRRRVDAVAQAGGAGAVVEDVAEMAVALRTQHLGADHAVGHVALLVDMAVDGRRRKTRPAAAGIELGVGLEQRLAAAGARIGALAVLVLILAGERPLGRLLAQHRILHRRQLAAPFGFALFDLGCRLDVGHNVLLRVQSSLHCERSEAIQPGRELLRRFTPRDDGLWLRQLVTFALLTSVGFSI